MTEMPKPTVIRERPLPEVKAEIVRRAAVHLNPFDGIGTEDAERVARELSSLDRDEWARRWSAIGLECESRADALAKGSGASDRCRELYESAFHCFRVGRYPCAGSPAQAESYRASLRAFRKAARYFDPPMEIVEVPFGDKKLTGYLQIPAGVSKPPVVMHWGGVDGWKEDKQRIHPRLNGAGLAGFAIDMPGTGESPLRFTDGDAGRTFSVLIDYLRTREDIDASRLGVWGGSFGGYWAAKLAFVEAERLKAAVFHGSNVHYGFQEEWLRVALTEKATKTIFGPKGLFEARCKALGVETLDELVRVTGALSLLDQGLLDRPSAPLLAVNGKLDDQNPIEDIYLLMEHGNPKEARIYPQGGHMGRGAGVRDEEIADMIITWLALRLSQ